MFTPLVIEGVTRENTGYREEFFGPVFILHKVSYHEEAIALANDS